MEDLEEHLKPLRAEGHLDSQGSFSLDGTRALEILGHYALEEPRCYILNLVSWAVASQATCIRIQVRPGLIEMRHDGQWPQQLSELFTHFGEYPIALQELAIGWATAARLPGSKVTLQTSQAGLRLEQGRFQPAEPGENLFRLEEPAPLNHWLRRAVGKPQREATLLEERGRHAGIPVYVNEAMISQPVLVPYLGQAIHLTGLPLPVEFSGQVVERPSPGNFSALVARCSVPILEIPALFLVRGVRFETDPLVAQGIPLVAVVQAPELSKDLSQAGLVHNPKYLELRQVLSQIGEELFS